MANLLLQLPVSTNNPLLRRLSRADVRPVGSPDIEPTATEFWQFNQGANSLVGLNRDTALTPLGNYGLSSNLLEVRTSTPNAFTTGISDSLEIAFAATIRAEPLYNVGKNSNLCGNINMNAATSESSGIQLRVQRLTRNLALAYRNQSTQEIHQLTAEMPSDLRAEQVLYVAGGRTLTHAYLYIGGVGYVEEILQGPAQASSVRDIRLGNGWSSQDSEQAGPWFYFGEFMIDRAPWVESDFDAAYARAKLRAADAGLSLY